MPAGLVPTRLRLHGRLGLKVLISRARPYRLTFLLTTVASLAMAPGGVLPLRLLLSLMVQHSKIRRLTMSSAQAAISTSLVSALLSLPPFRRTRQQHPRPASTTTVRRHLAPTSMKRLPLSSRPPTLRPLLPPALGVPAKLSHSSPRSSRQMFTHALRLTLQQSSRSLQPRQRLPSSR